MPSLIEVPKSKEDIAQFLADGNTRSVPAVTSADINDGDILNATQTVDLGGGSYKFTITLPSGRFLESAGVSPDYSRRDAGLQWVEAVRSAIVGDYEQSAEDSAKAARASNPIETGTDSYTPQTTGREDQSGGLRGNQHGDDPVEYAKQQLSAALQRLAAANNAEADVKKWSAVVAMLTGATEKPVKKRRKKRKAKGNTQ